MIEPRRLLTFREVARRESFSRAAEALALTQPAVSQQVAALERQLGAQLLERGPGGLALTAAGALLLRHADAVADRLAAADSQLRELLAGEATLLRVGAFASAVAIMVPAAIAALTASEPAMKVDVSEGGSEVLATDVGAGRLHVAVCFQDVALERREHPGTERTDLREERFVALLPPGHPLAGRGPIDLADLAAEVWVAPSREHLIARACRAAGFEPAIRYVSSDPLSNQSLVAAGLAVTIAPEGLARELHGIATAEVRGAPRRTVYAVLPDAGATRLARAFVAAIPRD
jgi:DNA-binding transcriptional LysR family regulator